MKNNNIIYFLSLNNKRIYIKFIHLKFITLLLISLLYMLYCDFIIRDKIEFLFSTEIVSNIQLI
jgi:hypothetical protein